MAQELRIPLKEVHCENCERRIDTALVRLPGVLRVKSSTKTNDVVVTLQGSRTDAQAIKRRLVELGYEPRE